MDPTPLSPPSDWIVRWLDTLVPRPGTTVLDLACGRGRHALALAARGARVTAVDRDAEALDELRVRGQVSNNQDLTPIDCVCADLEGDGPWPLVGRAFDAVVVTNYLWRPRFDEVTDLVSPGGWLCYETFAAGHEALGRPSRPEFLLRPGELLERLAHGWRIRAYEDLRLEDPPRLVQRILARKEEVPAAG